MRWTRLEPLASPLLMAAVAVLVLNDWVLKPAFHNALTGKLSDVAGVAAFALFWAALFPRHRLHAFLMTAAGFVVWKSPASQPLIDAWNALGLGAIGRVVDWTDLLALTVLPLVYRYDPRPIAIPRLRRVTGPAVALACVLAFGATSRVRPLVYLAGEQYTFDLPPDSVLQRMYDLRAGARPMVIPPGSMRDELDTLHLSVGVPQTAGGLRSVWIVAELARTPEGGSVLRPHAVSTVYSAWEPADAFRALEEQVIEPVRRNRPNIVHIEAPAVGSRPEIGPRILAPGELFASRAKVRVSIRQAAFLAVVEVTPRLDWQVIYPVDDEDVQLLPAGEHTLTTLCARAEPRDRVPPGEDVPPCAVAQRLTPADAHRQYGQRVPDHCPGPDDFPVARLFHGTLLLIAAEGPMFREALEESVGTWCRAHPLVADRALGRVLRRMRIHDWAAVDHDLRR
jgi:hypothetical protein